MPLALGCPPASKGLLIESPSNGPPRVAEYRSMAFSDRVQKCVNSWKQVIVVGLGLCLGVFVVFFKLFLLSVMWEMQLSFNVQV